MKKYKYTSKVQRTHNLVILPALITPPDLLDKSHSTLQSEKVCPLFESTHGLLDEDDLVGDRRVPLDLQLHVMVVLETETNQQINTRDIFIKTGLLKWIIAQEPNLIPYNLSWSSAPPAAQYELKL